MYNALLTAWYTAASGSMVTTGMLHTIQKRAPRIRQSAVLPVKNVVVVNKKLIHMPSIPV